MVSGVISVRTLRKIFAVFASFRRSGFQLLFLDQKLLNFLRECEFFGSKWCFWRFYSRDVHALGKRRDSSKRANFPGGLRGGFGGNLGFYFAFFGGGLAVSVRFPDFRLAPNRFAARFARGLLAEYVR